MYSQTIVVTSCRLCPFRSPTVKPECHCLLLKANVPTPDSVPENCPLQSIENDKKCRLVFKNQVDQFFNKNSIRSKYQLNTIISILSAIIMAIILLLCAIVIGEIIK